MVRTRRGGSGWFVAGLLVVALLIGAFFLFGGGLSSMESGVGDTNINVKVPDVNLPDVKVETPSAQVLRQRTNVSAASTSLAVSRLSDWLLLLSSCIFLLMRNLKKKAPLRSIRLELFEWDS